MAKLQKQLVLICFLLGLGACGSSKEGVDSGPVPDFGKRQTPVPDKDTLFLKDESLKLTHITQTWKFNNLSQQEGAERYLRLQKSFPFPIQFNGWVALDNVEHNYVKCAQAGGGEPEFVLEDDHKGSRTLRVGEKIPVSLEKLYEVRVLFPNQALCRSVDIQFGVLYGTNE